MNLGNLPSSFNLFAGEELDHILQIRLEDLKNSIFQMDRNELLNANDDDLIESFESRFTYDEVVIDTENISASEREGDRMVEDYGRMVRQRGSVYTFHIPISGEIGAIKMTPNPRVLRSYEFKYDGKSHISFDVFGHPDQIDNVAREKDSTIELISKQLASINNQIRRHNQAVKNALPDLITQRKKEVLKQMDSLSALGVPIKKKEEVSATFLVPTIKKKPKISDNIKTSKENFQPEPVLEQNTYDQIISLVKDFGIEIERHPSTYKGKDEESLRDHFILMLSPHFEGGATGETFNKSGKTDILIRYESKNVFVAECKFWHGKKKYLEAIDQILNYLTWRDSKASLIVFVDKKELNPVLETIKTETQNHSCYAKTISDSSEAEYRYRFHLPDDRTRSVFLTVLCFHYPK